MEKTKQSILKRILGLDFKPIILFGMVLWDWTLHLAETLGVSDYYPLYVKFPLEIMGSQISYNLFWCVYWGFGVLLALFVMLKWSKKRRENNEVKNLRDDMNKIINYLRARHTQEQPSKEEGRDNGFTPNGM